MPTMLSKIDENLVVKSNELIQASYAMTINEQRLLLSCISQIDSRKAIDEGKLFVLTVEEARDLFYTKGDQRHAYRDLQDASERLFERKVRIALPNNEELLTRFVQAVKFSPDTATVSIRFADEIMPYLSQLERNFTQYRLQNVVQLTSSYAIRIYELIVSWTGQNQMFKEMEIAEFKDLLGITYKYKQISELRSRVITPALEQINESTDFELDISFRKSRRTFKWVQLRYNRKAEAMQEEAQRKANKKIKHEKNQAAKAIRTQQEAATAAADATRAKRSEIDSIINSIPDGAVYVDETRLTYTKDGDFFHSEKGVLTSVMAFERLKKGVITPVMPDSDNLDLWSE